MCHSPAVSTNRGSIINPVNGDVLSHLSGPIVGANGSNQKPLSNPMQAITYNLTLTTQQNTTTKTSPSNTISTSQFIGPLPPPPQLFYWPYPSPPISPPSNFYTTLQNGANPLSSTLMGGPVQNSFQLTRPTGPLGIVPIGNLSAQGHMVTTSSPPHQTLNHLLSISPLTSPEVGKAVI